MRTRVSPGQRAASRTARSSAVARVGGRAVGVGQRGLEADGTRSADRQVVGGRGRRGRRRPVPPTRRCRRRGGPRAGRCASAVSGSLGRRHRPDHGESGARHGGAHLLDGAVARQRCLVAVAVGGGDEVEGAAIVVAEHAGEAGLDVVTRSSTSPPSAKRTHSGNMALATHTVPSSHRQMPSGETPAVAAHSRRLDSAPSSARSNAVRRPPMVSAMISVAPSSVMTVPLGNWMSPAASQLVPSGSTRITEAVAMSLRLERSGVEPVEVEAEVAGVGLAVGGHHHVVGVPGGPGPQVAVHHEGAVGLAAHDDPVEPGAEQEASVGQPAQAGRLPVEVHLDPAVALGGDGEDGVVEEVRVPEAAVVPAGALAEVEAREEGLGGQGCRSSRCAPPGPGVRALAVQHSAAPGAPVGPGVPCRSWRTGCSRRS